MLNNRANSGNISSVCSVGETILSEATVMFVDTCLVSGNITSNVEGPWNVQRLSRKGVGAERPRNARNPYVDPVVVQNAVSKVGDFVRGATTESGVRPRTGVVGTQRSTRMVARTVEPKILSTRERVCVAVVTRYSTRRTTVNESMSWGVKGIGGIATSAGRTGVSATELMKSSDVRTRNAIFVISTMAAGSLRSNVLGLSARIAGTAEFRRFSKFTTRMVSTATTCWRTSEFCVLPATKSDTTDCDIVRPPRRLGESVRKRYARNTQSCIHEHNPKMNGHWRNWMTCLKGIYDEAVCCSVLGANTRYYVGYFTVVDCSEWTDKKGNKYQYEIKLLGAKLKTLKKLRRKRDDRGSLIGCLFHTYREDSQSPSVGDEFEFKREADMEKLYDLVNLKGKSLKELFEQAASDADVMKRLKRTFELNMDADGKIVPELVKFNYIELLAPKKPADMKDMLGDVKPDDDDSGSSGSKDDEDVPF